MLKFPTSAFVKALGTDPHSTSAAGPGRSTVRTEPMRRQEPSESGLATVGFRCASGLPAGKNSSSNSQSPRNTEKFQLSAPTKRRLSTYLSPNPTVSKFTDARGDARRTLAIFPFSTTSQPNPTNKSCLSEEVVEVVTAVAVVASEVRRLYYSIISLLSPTLMSSSTWSHLALNHWRNSRRLSYRTSPQ